MDKKHKLPFPTNDRRPAMRVASSNDQKGAPWEVVQNKEPLPNFFRLRLHDGRQLSFAYADLREIRLIHAGHLVLCLYGMEKYHIVLEGRRLEVTFTNSDINAIVFHRWVENFFSDTGQAMDFVDKENITRLEADEQTNDISRAF